MNTKKIAGLFERLDAVMENMEAIKGKDYCELIMINLRVAFIRQFLGMMEADGMDKAMLGIMLKGVFEDYARQWATGKDKATVDGYKKTLKADVEALLKLTEESLIGD